MNKGKKRLITGCATILAVFLAATPIAKELHEHKQVDRIEENEQIQNVPRSLKNINQDDMGTYLKDTIKYLYEKYPNLDELIYLEDESTQNSEFLNDIYLLYKAEMVDSAEKDSPAKMDIEDVTITTEDQIIASSDIIKVNGENFTKTYKEQDKSITNMFIHQKQTLKYDGAKLAKRIYEYLVLEHGLSENELTSKEIQEQIEKTGFYYDESSDIFYTPQGRAQLELMDEKEQEQEQVQDNQDYDIDK